MHSKFMCGCRLLASLGRLDSQSSHPASCSFLRLSKKCVPRTETAGCMYVSMQKAIQICVRVCACVHMCADACGSQGLSLSFVP